MAVEIACGSCGNTFGVEAEWANLIVQCPFCAAAVQVPAEVASWASPVLGPGMEPGAGVASDSRVPRPADGAANPLGENAVSAGIDWQTLAPAVPEGRSLTPDFSGLAVGSEPGPAPPLPPVQLPPSPWTLPPTCAWLMTGGPDAVRVTVNEGTTTIRYQGQRVVLRAEPTATRWYGLTSFLLSILTLVILLTWMYFVYR